MAIKSLWFRLYTEVLNDPKVQKLDGNSFKFWINLLCCAKEFGNDGTLPDLEEIAFHLRIKSESVLKFLQKMIKNGLVEQDGETYFIHGWRARQYESDNDPTALDRKRRERDRKRDNKKDVTRDTTVTSRTSHAQCHVNVTRTETESETEYININNINSEPPKAEASPPEKIDPLYHKIRETFETASGRFADYAREGAAIKRIIKLAGGDETTVARMIETFYKLTKSQDRYWSGQPFLPSILSSGGIWPRVKLEVEKTEAAENLDWVDQYAHEAEAKKEAMG